MKTNCTVAPPAGLLRAIEEFNREDWFTCHETLEVLWKAEVGETREFYQGLIKVAGALHHWRNGNFVGALRLLEGGSLLLQRVSPWCQGVSLVPFVAAVDALRKALAELGPERMQKLPKARLPSLAVVEKDVKEPEP